LVNVEVTAENQSVELIENVDIRWRVSGKCRCKCWSAIN